MTLGKHALSPESPHIDRRTRQSTRTSLPSAKALAMATDSGRRQGRPLAQSPAAEPSLTDMMRYLQEMEMRHLNQTQQLIKGFEQNIEPLKEEIKAIAERNSNLVEGNTRLVDEGRAQAEEIRRLTDQVTQMAATITSLEKTVSTLPSPTNTRSYASAASSPHLLPPTIAVTPPNSSPALSSIPNPGLSRSTVRARHQLPCVELNLGETQVDVENARELQGLMNRALQATSDLSQAKCNAVMNRRKERVGFVFATEHQAQMIREKEPWKNLVEKDFTQARLIRQERFKVKLVDVDKHSIGNPGRGETIAKSILDQINDENELAIQTMRLLSQPSDRQTVQLVLVCKSQEEKDSLLNKGYIAIQGTLARTSEFFESQVLQCKKCGEFGHMARNCGNSERCLNCNEQGHDTIFCTNAPRCCNCFGNHPSQALSCPVRQRQSYNRRSNEW